MSSQIASVTEQTHSVLLILLLWKGREVETRERKGRPFLAGHNRFRMS